MFELFSKHFIYSCLTLSVNNIDLKNNNHEIKEKRILESYPTEIQCKSTIVSRQ